MEIAIIVILFLIGSIGGAIQALRFVERRQKRLDAHKRKHGTQGDGD